jgi:LmbE family N-acetylglucosaminyl deacetylase
MDISLKSLVVFAIAAHPDDIEFGMAGTLLRFREAGAEIHLWNLADGSCGTRNLPVEEITRIRWAEASTSAQLLGANLHPPIVQDLAIFYEKKLLARVAAVIREVRPSIMLIPSLQDYMEDHVNTARLTVTGAFAHGMPNFKTLPQRPPWEGDIAVYHAMPHGGLDTCNRRVLPERIVDITAVIARKAEMLACHESQRSWLRDSQGMDSYLRAMFDFSESLGNLSGRFRYGEGWQRHNPLGFSANDRFDPMEDQIPDAVRL